MSFLSGEKIRERLDEIILNEQEEPAGKHDQIDCNSYILSVGPEAYVTCPSYNCKDSAPTQLKNIGDSFTVHPGQFGLILTEEIIYVPIDLMGFISIKAKKKFRGLINVSGFHVDPGYKGRILFSVFNAGPSNLTVKRGEPFFLIWFSSLDRSNTNEYKPNKMENRNISTDHINNLSGELYSPQALGLRLERLESKWWLKGKTLALTALITFTIGILLGVAMDYVSDHLKAFKGSQTQTTATQSKR